MLDTDQESGGGEVALVTGGSRGIGRAIARRLAADGPTVAVHCGRDADAAGETVRAIEKAGGTAFVVRADLGAADGVDDLVGGFEAAIRERGRRPRLDVLVNNAAVVHGAGIGEVTQQDFDRVIAVNVRAPLFTVQRVLPLLADRGRIITISSLVTRAGSPDVAYVTSKGAVDAMTQSLAPALGARGITVNSVAPGLTDTDLMASFINDDRTRSNVESTTALGRVGEPEDVADVVAFLASRQAQWITGQVIDATGGQFLRPV